MCPNCGGGKLRPFYRTGAIPVHSCILLDDENSARAFPTRDLELGVCGACGFVSNVQFDASVQRYTTAYEEQQSFSPRFRAFQSDLVRRLVDRYELHEKNIVEIGCGKGDFLIELCEAGPNRGVGIDPASIAERVGTDHGLGVRFIQDLYDERHAGLPCDFLCCRHTLEHIYSTGEFVRRVREVIGERDDVVVFFEVPDGERVLREGAFWDIYYEHCSYFTLGSLRHVFESNGFTVDEAGKEFGDQYLVLCARPGVGERAGDSGEGADRVDVENTLRLVRGFESIVADALRNWSRRIVEWERAGKRVVIWGSGSKCVSFLSAVGCSKAISSIVDVNPHRHGRWLPGSARQITSPESLRAEGADVVIVMNPIYRNEISEDLGGFGLEPEIHCA